MRGITAIAAAAVLTTSAPVGATAFETPETAVREYLEGVAQADIDQVLETSAADELAEGYRFEQWVDRLGTYQSVSAGPVHSPFFADVEHVIWLSRLTRQAKTLAYSLLAPETLGEEGLYYGTVPDVGGGWATDLMAELDETRLKSLVVVDIRMPNPEWFDRPESQEIVAGMAQISGADHWTERVALLLFESDTYMVGFNLLRYGDDWKVYEQKSNIAGLHQSGTAWPVTASLFLERTSE